MSIMQPSDGSSMHREPIRLGISACLLGERVRFDGGHKRDPFLVETLGPFVEWVPARRRLEELAESELCGFVLKKGSPTCGLERVKVYGTGGMPLKCGRGLFADALVTRFPTLPVEEEGRLNDPRLRENFIERVFAYRRLALLFITRPREPRRTARAHRGSCDRAGAAGRAAHALRPSHPPVRCALSGGSGVLRRPTDIGKTSTCVSS